MPRFNFNEITKSQKADVDKIGENFDEIEENALIKSDIVDNLTTDDATKILSAKQGKVLNDKIIDSGWQSLTIVDTGFTNTSYVRYRKIGKLVEVQGSLQRDSSTNYEGIVVAIVPSAYKPSTDLYQYGFGYTYGEKIEIQISMSGGITIRPMEINNGTITKGIPGDEIIDIWMLYMID